MLEGSRAHAPRCVVIGGSGFVGRAVCAALSARGARLAFTWHEGEAAAREIVERHPGAIPRRLDLAHFAEVERAMDELAQELGGVDAFVHCAGLTRASTTRHERLSDVDEAGWQRLYAVNVGSACFAARRLAPAIARAGGGNMVLIGSIDGIKSVPAPVAYAGSKGALAATVRALAKELGRDRIRVNAVAPGVLDGGASRALDDDLRARYVAHNGLRRLGRADEVAPVAAWLAVDNSYVTGQTVALDGGL